MEQIPLLSPVALIEDIPNRGLTKGQMGTVVEFLQQDGESALLVEFSDETGQPYALADLQPKQLLILHRKTEAA